MRRLNRNPNAGKRHAARMTQRESRVKASRVKVSYMPGKTVAARIKGIEDYYARQLRAAQIGA